MVVHQHEGQEADAKRFGQPSEQFQEVKAVAVILENGPPLDPASGDVIPNSQPDQSWRTGHAVIETKFIKSVK